MAARGTKTTALGLEDALWEAANRLRSSMDAAEYKHVVLGLLFLKYVPLPFLFYIWGAKTKSVPRWPLLSVCFFESISEAVRLPPLPKRDWSESFVSNLITSMTWEILIKNASMWN